MKEANEDPKSIFICIINNLKTPEIPGGILILLLIYKYFYNDNFSSILNKVIYKYSMIQEIIEVIIGLLTISCIIAFIIFIFSILVIIFSGIIKSRYEHKARTIPDFITKRIELTEEKGKGYLGGSTIFLIHKVAWMIILAGYLYILDENSINKYLYTILNMKETSYAPLLSFFLIIGFISSVNLLALIIQKYFYEKL